MTIETGRHRSPETSPSSTEILSLRSPFARSKAASLAKEGLPFGSYNRGVCAIWGDGANPDFPDTVARIKGEQRGDRPLAASLSTERFVELLDASKIPESLRGTFLDARELASRTGSLCFFRGPITESAARELPPSMVSYVDDTPVIQNWDAKGHRPTHKLLRAMEHAGIEFPAVTSMNISGQPEITDQDAGKVFSAEHGIPLFLEDKNDPHRAVGSYTILGVADDGLKLIREGNIPSELLMELLGTEIDTSEARLAKAAKPLEFPAERIQGVNPKMARIAIISSLRDHPEFIQKSVIRAGKILK